MSLHRCQDSICRRSVQYFTRGLVSAHHPARSPGSTSCSEILGLCCSYGFLTHACLFFLVPPHPPPPPGGGVSERLLAITGLKPVFFFVSAVMLVSGDAFVRHVSIEPAEEELLRRQEAKRKQTPV